MGCNRRGRPVLGLSQLGLTMDRPPQSDGLIRLVGDDDAQVVESIIHRGGDSTVEDSGTVRALTTGRSARCRKTGAPPHDALFW